MSKKAAQLEAARRTSAPWYGFKADLAIADQQGIAAPATGRLNRRLRRGAAKLMLVGEGERAVPALASSVGNHQPRELTLGVSSPQQELGGAAVRDMLPMKLGCVMETALMSEI